MRDRRRRRRCAWCGRTVIIGMDNLLWERHLCDAGPSTNPQTPAQVRQVMTAPRNGHWCWCPHGHAVIKNPMFPWCQKRQLTLTLLGGGGESYCASTLTEFTPEQAELAAAAMLLGGYRAVIAIACELANVPLEEGEF